jgi:DNA-binding transcriptional MocR family regulator
MIRRSGAYIVEFYIDNYSSVPVIAQIEEQIKLAVAMGVFRNGDRLPSIREVEKQTGVNRGKIYRAYLSLQQSGLLVLACGREGCSCGTCLSVGSTNQEVHAIEQAHSIERHVSMVFRPLFCEISEPADPQSSIMNLS